MIINAEDCELSCLIKAKLIQIRRWELLGGEVIKNFWSWLRFYAPQTPVWVHVYSFGSISSYNPASFNFSTISEKHFDFQDCEMFFSLSGDTLVRQSDDFSTQTMSR